MKTTGSALPGWGRLDSMANVRAREVRYPTDKRARIRLWG